MPFLENTDPGFRADVAKPPAAAPEGDPLAAAFRQQNTVVSFFNHINNSGPFTPDPSHNPMDVIRGTPYEASYGDAFVGSRSDGETRSIMRRIDQEENDKRVLEANGVGGTLMQMLAGGLDPTMAMPSGMAIKVGKEGYAIGKAALATGAAFGAQSVAQEAGLHATQVDRSLGESALNVGSATILGALIGPLAAKLLTPAEHAAAVGAIDRERAAMDAHRTGSDVFGAVTAERPVPTAAPPLIPEPAAQPGLSAALSAAGTDTRRVELVPYGLDQIPGVAGVVERTDPMLRTFGAESVTARRTIADLAETPLLTKENLEGIPTTAGPALDRIARMDIASTRVAVADELDRLFSDYRFGSTDITYPRARAQIERFTGSDGGKMTFAEFKAQVSQALQDGDKHAIPQVQQAAQFVRGRVFDPWKQRAIDAGLFPEDMAAPKGAESYLQRVYNKQAIAAKRPDFVNKVTDWLSGDQASKAAAQERIQAYHGALTVAQDTAKKLSAQIESRSGSLEKVQTRAEEVQRFNKFAFQRSEKLSQPLDEARAKIRTIEAKIEPHLTRLGEIGDAIKAEKVNFPEIKDADSLIFKMIGAAQKLKQSKELIDAVEAAREYVSALDQTIGGFKGGIREASAQAKRLRRDLGADTLVSLENSRTALRKEIAPFIKALGATKRELRNERAAKLPGAHGGAVFESNIRNRGNTLADQASGRSAEIAALEDRLIKENANAEAMRAKIEKEIAAWEGQSASEAKSALKVREKAEKLRAEAQAAETYKGKGDRLSSADSAIDRAVKRIIESDRALSPQELRSQAQEITDRILGSPDGRLPYDIASGGPEIGHSGGGERPRGPLAERKFAIPDALIRDYLESDIEHIVNTHLRTMVPDVLLSERFGDVRMTEAFRKINDEYAAMIDAAKSDKARTKLEKERQGVIRDIAAIRDRTRHLYGLAPEGPMRQAGRVIGAVKNFNVLTSMGMAAVSSIPDMAGAVFRHGLGSAFGDAWAPWLRSMMGQSTAWKEAKSQFRAMGISIETTLASRAHSLSDTMDAYRPQSRLERTLQYGADKFQLLNLLAPWTDWAKTSASLIAGSEILRAAKASVGGTATKRQIRALAESGIDASMAQRIHAAFQTGGEVRDGVHLPNTADWTDATARRAFEGAVGREADISVITPGAEKPLWMSQPVLSVFGQFKSFTAAATTRLLIANLQRRDAQVLQGLITSLGMGMLSYKINSLTGGQPTSDRPQDWIKEAMSRSNVLGWLEEGNSIASKATRGGVDVYRLIGADKPASRFVALSAKDQLLGPTAGKVEAMLKVTSAGAARDWTHSDTTALRRLMIGQNLVYLRGLFNQVEAGANSALGVAPKPEPTKH